jgi:hypothetical protein
MNFMLFLYTCGTASQRLGDFPRLIYSPFVGSAANLAPLDFLKLKISGDDIYGPRIFTSPEIRYRTCLSKEPAKGRAF